MEWFLVGGAVRDLLLGRVPRERDMAFSGQSADMVRAYPEARKVGKSVHVWLLRGMECMPLRGGSLENDLHARDLTINAMALDEQGRLHTHPLALNDLREKILRPASDTAFFHDPVRIFRLARFAATFPDFSLHPGALVQAKEAAQGSRLAALSPERVGNELRKALRAKKPSRFLQVLAQADALSPWLEELVTADTVPAGPPQWHNGSVLDHICTVMDMVRGDELCVWMALCHDLGKVSTPAATLPHHYGHEERGALAATRLGERLALPRQHILAGALAAREHMKGARFAHLRSGTQRDLLHTVHSAGLDSSFWKLVDADGGEEVSNEALRALHCMLSVSLPEHKRNLGAKSGATLRALQCAVLIELKRRNP